MTSEQRKTLTEQLDALAYRLWPDSEVNQQKWVAAARYLLTRNRWVLYGGAVTWKN